MINKGNKVVIIGSAEEEKYKGCVFEVLSEPLWVRLRSKREKYIQESL